MSLGEALERSILSGALDWHFQKAEVERLLPELGERVMAPLRAGLDALGLTGDEHRIMLIPCGPLGALPWHAAPVPAVTTGTVGTTTEMVPFLETCECAYQTSAVQMLGTLGRLPTLPAPAPLYVIGAPAPTRAPPLPWAELGAKVNVAFALRAGRSQSEALLKTKATRWNVRTLLSGVRTRTPGAIIELATHGATDPYDPHACYVLLAHNEALSLAQLQREALLDGVRCCIAGGCFTGIGDLFTAPDEVSSFASGILQAGASSAIATLWGVSDRATFLLMRRLHSMLGLDASVRPAAALREAIRWLRGATREEIGTVVRKALTDVHSASKDDLSRDVARGLLLEADEEEAVEDDSPPLAATEGGTRSATGVRVSRAFINVDQEEAHPYAHPVYWAGFVVYGV